MAVFLQIFGVDHHAVVSHAHLVEHLAQQHIERTELGAEFAEVDAPFHHIFTCGHHFGVFQFVESSNQTAATNQNFAFAACIAGEGVAHEIHHLVLGEFLTVVVERLAGLIPNAAREQNVLLFCRIPQFFLHTEQERLLHAQAHIVDGGFLLVAHVPRHFLVAHLHERALLNLAFENLAEVACLLWKRLKLWRHHIEFAGGSSHANEDGAFRDFRHAVLGVAHLHAVGCHHPDATVVVLLFHHI